MPWSLDFYRQYRPVLTLGSLITLRRALIDERRDRLGFEDEVELHLRQPYSSTVTLRPRSNDIYTFSEIFFEKLFAPLLEGVKNPATVIDLGANIGLSTLFFLRHWLGCRVFALEPDLANFRLANRNLKNFANRAVVERAAVWTNDGLVRFAAPEKAGEVNAGSVVDAGGVEVHGYSLPTIIAKSNFRSVDLLKIDVEGAERHLFDGSCDWLKDVRAIAIEFHGDARAASGFDAAMTRHRFRISESRPGAVLAVKDSS